MTVKAACVAAIKPSERIQSLSAHVNGCMAVHEWKEHTQYTDDEKNGSFSQQYNDGESVQTKSGAAGGSFSRSLNRTPRENVLKNTRTSSWSETTARRYKVMAITVTFPVRHYSVPRGPDPV